MLNSLSDLPHNVVISETGRGAGGETHPLDVIVFVKRFAADQSMCQDFGELCLTYMIPIYQSCCFVIYDGLISCFFHDRRLNSASRTGTWPSSDRARLSLGT